MIAKKTGSLELVKLMINSVCWRPNAKFMTADLGNFYLRTPLDHKEYVQIKLSTIPQEFIDEYDLLQFARNGWVYLEVSKGMFKQAGKLSNKLLADQLHAHRHYICTITPGPWQQNWRQVMFVLFANNFGVEYICKVDADHLLQALHQLYKVKKDWMERKFAGIDIQWDNTK
jgi:hypothetical protein